MGVCCSESAPSVVFAGSFSPILTHYTTSSPIDAISLQKSLSRLGHCHLVTSVLLRDIHRWIHQGLVFSLCYSPIYVS